MQATTTTSTTYPTTAADGVTFSLESYSYAVQVRTAEGSTVQFKALPVADAILRTLRSEPYSQLEERVSWLRTVAAVATATADKLADKLRQDAASEANG